ncbi:hypothetical protein [Wenzhouxiangella marina]|uniref:Uncharacterized protein n=1 Tax=Wenzhouxiangella marina TaxID=1579979 RepID=A0A0K0XU66_9GAMM|nr:hypothetical protein [Wenzhouxiangella marina]AKS41195.1 hypothetical protein WM2015_814 [Wenzhouxiangella marina]MBB6088074.1 hypothetical protein [Wenzhouxiangella marina]
MILRSITEHVRDQNWFAVFLDFPVGVIDLEGSVIVLAAERRVCRMILPGHRESVRNGSDESRAYSPDLPAWHIQRPHKR